VCPSAEGREALPPSVSVKQSGELAHITRVHGTGMFKVMATGVSDNIGVEDDKFTVPAREAAEWKVEIWVNTHPPSRRPRCDHRISLRGGTALS